MNADKEVDNDRIGKFYVVTTRGIVRELFLPNVM